MKTAAEFNVTYYKSVPLIPGATIRQAFQQASSVPFSLIVASKFPKDKFIHHKAQHWAIAQTRLQFCGPNWSQRKWIWIMPYQTYGPDMLTA
jgi:hypothetical protein